MDIRQNIRFSTDVYRRTLGSCPDLSLFAWLSWLRRTHDSPCSVPARDRSWNGIQPNSLGLHLLLQNLDDRVAVQADINAILPTAWFRDITDHEISFCSSAMFESKLRSFLLVICHIQRADNDTFPIPASLWIWDINLYPAVRSKMRIKGRADRAIKPNRLCPPPSTQAFAQRHCANRVQTPDVEQQDLRDYFSSLPSAHERTKVVLQVPVVQF